MYSFSETVGQIHARRNGWSSIGRLLPLDLEFLNTDLSCTMFWWVNLKENEHIEDLDKDG
jgi:hypothetical protein